MVEEANVRVDDIDVMDACMSEIAHICTIYECSQYISSDEIPHDSHFYLNLILDILQDTQVIE